MGAWAGETLKSQTTKGWNFEITRTRIIHCQGPNPAGMLHVMMLQFRRVVAAAHIQNMNGINVTQTCLASTFWHTYTTMKKR